MSGQTINKYLRTPKLFSSETNKNENSHGLKNIAGRSHDYHLLNQPLNKSKNQTSLDESQKVEEVVSRIKIENQSHYQSAQPSRNPKKMLKNLNTHTIVHDTPTEEQEAPNMQFIVTKSSKKYFDSCRTQGLAYISKLEQILNKDNQFLKHSLAKIHSSIEQTHAEIVDNIKQQLYRIVDLVAEKWRTESLKKFYTQEIMYIGQLYELNTQIEQRYKQIMGFKEELDHERMWRNRASDLLTSTYEGDLIQLSMLCKKSVEAADVNVKRYWQNVKKDFSQKLGESEKIELLRDRVFVMLKEHAVNKTESKSTGAPVSEDQAKTLSKVSQDKSLSGQKNLNKKLLPTYTTAKQAKNTTQEEIQSKSTYQKPGRLDNVEESEI